MMKLAAIYFLIGFKVGILPLFDATVQASMDEASKDLPISITVGLTVITAFSMFFLWPVFILASFLKR
jgi:hypothetical protein